LATMGRPVLFRQRRPGLHGVPFELNKFRTMSPLTHGVSSSEDEAVRITRLGRVLRSTSLDEVPTLFNVLKGDMSLVGPRPLLMRYLDRYTPEQARRHDAKPGITGWAQVNGRNSLAWEDKFAMDVWYVDNRSIALDLKILVKTAVSVWKMEGISHPGSATMTEFLGPETAQHLKGESN
jgi:sugar transferase EpsL